MGLPISIGFKTILDKSCVLAISLAAYNSGKKKKKKKGLSDSMRETHKVNLKTFVGAGWPMP